MAIKVTMPRLSDTMTEGTVATWLKKVGDKVSEGDILAEIETDKATMEFESFNEGTLLHIGIQAGETAPVDSLLAIIGKEGEDISALLAGGDAPAAEAPKADAPAAEAKTETAAPAKAAELPKGVVVVTMPRLSDTMTEGTVATWLKKVGDTVAEGDILAEIETDKATMEFESFNAGTLLYIGIQEGNTAPVDSLLAIIGPAGTDISGIAENYTAGGAATASTPAAEEKAAPAAEKAPEAAAETSNGGRILASPLAKKIASDKGIQLSQVKGSGENGRIVKSDIENFTPSAQAQTAASAPAAKQEASAPAAPKVFVPAGEVYTEEIKNSQMRKIIAKRLSESLFTAPHYNLVIEVSMDEAMQARAAINSVPDTKVSFNDMVIKACALALKKHPKINSTWKEDAIIINHHVNIGVAVAVEDGLVVPVLKFTDAMSLSQIGGSVRDLAGRAKNKKLGPQEMEGSTFTVSNLGMFGITEFNSIINQPNSAILSVGAIVEKPVVKNGQIVVGNTMMLSLACDHRTIDGATGAQFLQTLKQYIESPVTMLA
ncbi:pyruvate dehydrogenase complex dihydrolipoamide acetyltransferase [Flavobacterium johnsoniae]|uniref:Dihydrolipoamide acetyltransferase component of pyruvate dehydrogenase complex n=1 Tax=Flavobacterium johnsoniae (strain ATCC 17061 / DSM 2064 / JCM 8514 / BCRC 14874 / CCUG 350202 / NBRC 14942 / NCIMB 11054 / UW101) TaxID=376686 RepID=A5FJN7_FLAJ1|nr:pyruvate dehydrogenase complex dihydrolipoamide acetyltransferase [Flavobacterium johnsoniae]ABQ04584.1 pyruvate dehydrogenase complex dihydrolipoamide acetyltransferase [Flavobacterium johnsoniae UW101]OXE97906.1 pyruvate dehydrogenase [Flavobacterium johnsoniae UW101]WQG83620.1 2-oxo acid dehydrogenase subunit E2 [Flavobacterium johnsoniae UW101]SHK26929.1 pyruvate dehydrogenase E2 component (dihydrolipoamide acetyltransferase) [Flavobacterium johnsoniae]